MRAVAEVAVWLGIWTLAVVVVRKARAHPPQALKSAMASNLTLATSGAHPLFWLLRTESHISLWHLWWSTWIAGFGGVTVLAAIEGSLHSANTADLMFLDAVADPLNYCVLAPSCIAVASSFIRSTPLWFYDLYNNLLTASEDGGAKEHYQRWMRDLDGSPWWRLFASRPFNAMMLAISVAFPAWAYIATGRKLPIYGIPAGTPTILGWYVITALGLITYVVVTLLLVAVLTLNRFSRTYEEFEDRFEINPFHPDGSAGMLFAGKMALRLVSVFSLAALMVAMLISRDLQVGVSQPYHIVAPFLFVIVVLLSCRAVWAPHLILIKKRDEWVTKLQRTLFALSTGLRTGDGRRSGEGAKEPVDLYEDVKKELERREEMKKIRDLGRDHPTWPLNLRDAVSFIASVIAAIILALLSGLQVLP